MSTLRRTAADWLGQGEVAVMVRVASVRGSAPREAGARMLVSATRCAGTIGGGHLELKAIQRARERLCEPVAVAQHAAQPPARFSEHFPLGPALGQCCGGAVTLDYAPLDEAALQAWPAEPPRFHLQIYGAGHVGRSIVGALAPLNVSVNWIDEREEEFPEDDQIPPHTLKLCVDDVQGEVALAPPGACYLVLTHRHDLDLRITQAIARRGDFRFLGLIGSGTKRARFWRRLQDQGITQDVIGRITCPIGVPGISGKEPEVIAAAVVAQLLQVSSSVNLPHALE